MKIGKMLTAVLLAATALGGVAPAAAGAQNREWRGDRNDRARSEAQARGQRIQQRSAAKAAEYRREQRMERRDDRRDDRRDWRQDRGEDRREWRQDAREDRREDRRDWNNDRRRYGSGYERPGYRNDYRWEGNGRNWSRDWRRDSRYDWRGYRGDHRQVYALPRYYGPRGHSYRRWAPGYRMDPYFYGSTYWISDPWRYRLPPAWGDYRWIRYYDDVMLVDTYTGLISDIEFNFFF